LHRRRITPSAALIIKRFDEAFPPQKISKKIFLLFFIDVSARLHGVDHRHRPMRCFSSQALEPLSTNDRGGEVMLRAA
jgi:hypothetical protein